MSVNLSVGRGEKRPTSAGAGLTQKGRDKYNRETGSNLKAPVTQKNPTGKAAARKKSFCARMSGMKGATSENGKLTRKGAALKRWRCNLTLTNAKRLARADRKAKAQSATKHTLI